MCVTWQLESWCIASARKNHGDPVLRRGNKFLSLLLVNEGTKGQGINNTKKKSTVSSYMIMNGHTLIFHRAAVKEFSEQVITCRLWLPSTSTHLNPCDYTCRGHSKIAHGQNPCSLQQMTNNILKDTAIIPMHCCAQRNTISKCEVRYKAGCQHFRTVLQHTVRGTAREIRTPKFPADAGFAAGQFKRQVPRTGTSLCSDRPTQPVFFSRTLCQERIYAESLIIVKSAFIGVPFNKRFLAQKIQHSFLLL